jgi:hypothetical protein
MTRRTNTTTTRSIDVDQNAWEYMRKTRADGSVKIHQKMVTRSQTCAIAKDRRAVLNGTGLDKGNRAHDRA